MSASKIQRRSDLNSWDTENMIQVIKAVCNKQMGYLTAAKNITCLVLHHTIIFAQIRALFKPPSTKLGRKSIISAALEKKLVECILLIERKYFGCTRDDVRSLSFQLAVENKIPVHFQSPKKQEEKTCSNVV